MDSPKLTYASDKKILCFVQTDVIQFYKWKESSVTRKNRQMSIKIAQKNDFTRKIIYFDTYTKIAWEFERFGQINFCQRL